MKMQFLAALMLAVVPASAAPKPAITTLMYLVNGRSSIASFRAHAAKISIVAPQTFSMDSNGFIMGEVPAEVLEIAARNHVAVTPLVTNRGFKQPLMHTVLDTPESRARAIRYLIYFALRDGYRGFQFDFENIHYTYRDKFTVFFREAARAFHRHHLELSAAVVGRYDDTRNSNSPGGYDDWSGVYDYRAMGKVADFISVMAYAEHGSSDPPGPVAGLPWTAKIARYSASAIPPRKVSLGVPFYGQRWDAADPATGKKWRGHSVRYSAVAAQIANTPAVWDEQQSSPRLSFDANGRRAEVWFENARSLELKMELAHASHFAGISAWVLGQEDPAFWDALDRWQVRHPRAVAVQGSFDQRSRKAAHRL
jgi:spore germination protein YaaH